MAKRQKFEIGMSCEDLMQSQLEFDLTEINSIKEVPIELLTLIHCPITLEPIKEPVITPQGIVYEKEALLLWIKQNGTCPLTRHRLSVKDIKVCDMKQSAKICGQVKSQGQIIEMLNELMRVGISLAHEIVETEEGWLLINRK
jgi:hypothetical protein